MRGPHGVAVQLASRSRTLPAFDRAIEEGRAKGRLGQGPFRYGWFANWNIRFMEPPPKRLMRADGLDLARVRVISPVSRCFRLPLGAYFAFVMAHDRRHLWQARQVRTLPGFGLQA